MIDLKTPYDDLYEPETLQEAIDKCEAERKKCDLFGGPIEVSRYNIWTDFKNRAEFILKKVKEERDHELPGQENSNNRG